MRMCDGTVIDDNKYHWGAFLAGLGEDDLKEVVLVLDDAEPCIPAEAVRWGILNLIEERDEARQEAKKWRDKALYQRTVPALNPDVMPLSPLQAFGFMAQKDDERAREFCERLLRLCHEAWFFDSSPWVEDGRPWQDSPGCMAEYDLAREWHIPCVEMAFERGRIWLKAPHLRRGSTPRGQTA